MTIGRFRGSYGSVQEEESPGRIMWQNTHERRKENSEDTELTTGGSVGCLSGISPLGFLRCESVTSPIASSKDKNTSSSLNSLIKAQSHQLIAFGNPQRGARESQNSFLQINCLFLRVQSYIFYAFSMSESLRVSNHFSYTNLHILPVKVFSQEILLYFLRAMGLVKDLVTCVVNWWIHLFVWYGQGICMVRETERL